MAIQRTHKQSDLEKRLKLLNQQLYGKKPAKKWEVRNEKGDNEMRSEIQSHLPLQNPHSHLTHPTSTADIIYLRQDLLKILILAGLAFVVELGIYFSHIYSKLRFF